MREFLVAVGHTAFARVLVLVIQFVATTVLARNLSAADYGIVGFANGIMALLTRVNSLGISAGVIRAARPDEETLATAATLNTILSLVAFSVAQAVAPAAGWLLGSPTAVLVVRVLAIRLLFSPINFLADCLLSREMKFGQLRVGAVIGVLVRGLVSVTLAVSGWKYWSLVAGVLADILVGSAIIRRLRPVKYHYSLDRAQATQLLAFGVPFTLAGLAAYAVVNVDNFVIGTLLGASVLGYYAVALSWATYGCGAVQDVVQMVLFPKLAQMQEDPVRLKSAYLRTLRMVTWAMALVNISLLVVAHGFLFTWLGAGTPRWLPAQTTLQVLCVYGVLRASLDTAVNPVLALGETRLLLKAQLLGAVTQTVCLPLIAIRVGIEGVAVLVTVAYGLQYLVYFPFLKERVGVSAGELTKMYAPIAVASLLASGLAFWVTGESSGAPVQIAVRLAVVSVTFVATHELMTRGRILSECRSIAVTLLPNARVRRGEVL